MLGRLWGRPQPVIDVDLIRACVRGIHGLDSLYKVVDGPIVLVFRQIELLGLCVGGLP